MAVLGFSLPASAQDANGPALTFGLSTKLESTNNLALSASSAGRTNQALTSLSFGFLTDTPLNKLNLTGSFQLQAAKGPGGNNSQFDFGNRTLGFGYLHRGANSSFNVNGSYNQIDIAYSNPLDLFLVNGVLELPTDSSLISGTGIRQSYALKAKLTFGDEGPWGGNISAGISGQTYTGTSSPSLVDNHRSSVGAGLRYNLNPATQATLDFNRGTYTQNASGSVQTVSYGLTAGLMQTMVNGNLSVTLTAKDDFGTNRYSLSFGRSLDLPTGSVSASLGAAYSQGGSTNLIGSLNWQQTLPKDSSFGVQFQQQVSNDSSNAANLVSALTATYSLPLSPVSGLKLDAQVLQNRPLASGSTTTDTSLTATYSHNLTPDWNADMGYIQRLRHSSSTGNSSSGAIFLELSRNFELRF